MESTARETKVLMGIGNAEMGDDSAGVAVSEELLQHGKKCQEADRPHDWIIYNCGLYPENYIPELRRKAPGLLVMVDAVDMALDPGEIRIINKINMQMPFLSTHKLPLSSMIHYLRDFIPQCLLIGIQPGFVGSSSTMTPPVRDAVMELSRILAVSGFDEIKTLE